MNVNGQRIVITGVGAISPNGIGRERYFESVQRGISGIRPISFFDANELPSRVAGEVREFDPGEWIDPKQLKHVSRTVPMVLAASSEALADAG
ncbi:MAG: beta-ketoacyl synthase N-terminal-like domain-containing protein, partial [Thermoanaerobaculia bacterium]|nr:beta-ketoacyl synthase N-terminal-like domain-containing protein [Thermoanaerobaculia bacterium]